MTMQNQKYSTKLSPFFIAIIFAVLTAFNMQAARATDWDGFYAGLNIGLGGTTGDTNPTCIDSFGVANGPDCINLPSISFDGTGAIGGLQFGYLWQQDEYLVGIEVDVQAASVSNSGSLAGLFSTFAGAPLGAAVSYSVEQNLKWFGTARARIGQTIGNDTFLYGTGGLAVGNYQLATNTVGGVSFAFPASGNVTKLGWTIGAGVEQAIAPNTRLKLEALYYDLGDAEITGNDAGFVRGTKYDLNGFTVRVGLNWAFGELYQ